MILLEIDRVTKMFGGLPAVKNFSCQITKGECHGLIGPNGAGKTTLFNVIAGIYRPNTGKIMLKGENVAGLRPHVIARKGIARTFQIHILFESLSILDNMMAAYYLKSSRGFWDMLLQTRHARKENKRLLGLSLEALEMVGLIDLREESVTSLGHVAQGKLGIAMALATEPQLLLLDEPVSGMTSSETEDMIDFIRKIIERGITVIMVEHNMRAIMSIADMITVLNFGEKIAEGSAEEIKENKDVIKAYLGE